MKAEEARRITDKIVRDKLDSFEFQNSIGMIIYNIKNQASHGNSSYDCDIVKKERIRILIITELENLGYKVTKHDNEWLLIQW